MQTTEKDINNVNINYYNFIQHDSYANLLTGSLLCHMSRDVVHVCFMFLRRCNDGYELLALSHFFVVSYSRVDSYVTVLLYVRGKEEARILQADTRYIERVCTTVYPGIHLCMIYTQLHYVHLNIYSFTAR